MNLTTRLSRRVVASASLAAAAALLPTAALASSAVSGGPAHPAVARCTSGHTRVWLAEGADGAAGTFHYQLEFSNVGGSACTLAGFPGVSELNFHGTQVGKPATRRGPANGTITLLPGDTAHVVLFFTDGAFACPGHTVQGALLRVFPPNQSVSQDILFRAAMCPGKSTMSVDSMHVKAGIPSYSAS